MYNYCIQLSINKCADMIEAKSPVEALKKFLKSSGINYKSIQKINDYAKVMDERCFIVGVVSLLGGTTERKNYYKIFI